MSGVKKNKDNVTFLGLIFAFLCGRSYKKNSYKADKKTIAKGRWITLCIVVVIGLISIWLFLWHPQIRTTVLVTYNALVIAASVFLLNHHIAELRDVVTFFRKNSNSPEDFKFWVANKTQNAGVRIVEVKAFYIGVIFVAIVFLMISSFIVIAHIDSLSLLALGLSIISSMGIIGVLTLTIFIYLKASVDFAGEHPFEKA